MVAGVNGSLKYVPLTLSTVKRRSLAHRTIRSCSSRNPQKYEGHGSGGGKDMVKSLAGKAMKICLELFEFVCLFIQALHLLYEGER